jgi:hypothetical protein
MAAPDALPQQGPDAIKRFLGNESTAAENDYNSGQIKPETYKQLFDKKDTLGKIGTIFGLLVGGAGAGITHTPNVALEMMDKEIQRDLEAQKTSASNRQNFLKLTQQNPEIQAQIKNLGANTAATNQTIAYTHMLNAGMHDLSQQIEKMPENTPQQIAAKNARRQAAQAMMQLGSQKLSDVISGASIMGPEAEGAQAPEAGGDKYGVKTILKPNATGGGTQFRPAMQKDYDEFNKQLTTAQQADKALQNLGPTFDALSKTTSYPGHLQDRTAKMLGGIPLVGGFLEKGIDNATNTDTTRQYQSSKTALLSDMVNAFKGTNVHGDEIQKVVDDNAPDYEDSPETLKKKRENIEGFIKRSVPTSMLKKYGYTKD